MICFYKVKIFHFYFNQKQKSFFLAYEYEKLQTEGEFLEDFFSNSTHNIKTDIVQQWLNQLMECRSSGKQFQLPSDSNLNTMLKHILYDDQGLY